MLRTQSTIWAFLMLTYQIGLSQSFEVLKYYDSEKKQIQEILTIRPSDSLPDGPYFSYFQSGNPKINGLYKNGKADSLWTYFYENGQKKSEGNYKRSIQSGTWRHYYESGSLKAKGAIAKGDRTGYWINYFENGTEKSSGSYFQNDKEGLWNYFFEDGEPKAQAYYESGNGVYKQFYPSGAIRMQGFNKQEKSDGKWTYYYEGGDTLAIGSFIQGVRNGEWKYFHQNGILSAEGKYDNGKRTGVWKYYFENGKKSSEGKLVNDKRDGQWSLYYETGEVKASSNFNQGDGLFTEYYPSGAQKAKGIIKNEEREGKWIYFNENGVMDGEAEFKKGIGHFTGYYENQTIKMQGTLDNDKRIGEWKLYSTEGELSGVYRPIYQEDKPFFRITETIENPTSADKVPSEKPEYIYKDKKSRFFQKTVNEYQGFILATNPLWILFDEMPFSIEYYYQERLGYELQIIYLRNPFLKLVNDFNLNEPYSQGLNLRFRQKFYNSESKVGMWYFGHEINVSSISYKAKVQDQTALPFERKTIESNETLMAYGLFVGFRWMRNGQKPGLTVDSFLGIDIGLRNWEKLYDETNDSFDDVFRTFNQSNLYLPITFGVNIGGALKRKSK